MARTGPQPPLIERIEPVRTVSELRQLVSDFLAHYGLRNAVYHGSKIPGDLVSAPTLLTTYPVAWVEHYRSKNYLTIDPVVRIGGESLLPLDWSELPRRSARIRRFFGEAKEFGVGRHGMTIPVRGLWGERSLFSITSDATDRDWQADKMHYASHFQVLAWHFHYKALALETLAEQRLVALSQRERECLQLLASGRAPKQISADLGISESAVRLYISSARKKLGTINTNHAISRATWLGLMMPS